MKWYHKLLFWRKQKLTDKPAIEYITDMIPILMTATILIGAIKYLFGKIEPFIWLKSPNGKYHKFPLYQGLRIIRKHEWEVVDTEPIMTRWQHFKIAIGLD